MKKILSLILVIVMICSTFAGMQTTSHADDLPASGSCGTNVKYTYDSESGTLTISGSGAMTDYLSSSSSPFYCQTCIKTVVIESGVTSIGYAAFCGCSELTSISIPNSVTSLGCYEFSGCSSLTSVIIPKSLTSIDVGAFQGCGLTSIIIPASVKTIESWAFYNCSSLTTVLFSNSVTRIESEAFRGCCSLKNITLPSSLKSIGYNAFGFCNNLEKISIHVSVTSIEAYAFSECEALKDVYYSGKKEQWKSISIKEGNDYLINATLHAPGNELDFSTDVWKFKNFSHQSCHTTGERAEQQFPELSQLRPSSRAAVNDALCHIGDGGHCFGMCAMVILQKIGKEDFTQWSSVDNLRQLDNTGTVCDKICYYQALQVLADYRQAAYFFINKPVSAQLKTLAEEADLVKKGGNPVLLTFSNETFVHAVVAYAVESGKFTSSSTGIEYNRRVLLYDSNAVNWNEDYCLLFNQGTAEWEIPKYALKEKVTSYHGADLLCATKDVSFTMIWMVVPYISSFLALIRMTPFSDNF